MGDAAKPNFSSPSELVDGLAQAGQNVIANADGRTLICPRDVQEDAGRRAVLLVPVQRRGDQIAVPVLAATTMTPTCGSASLRTRRLKFAIRPSAVSSFKMRLRSILSEPLMPKARAISRRPILPGLE